MRFLACANLEEGSKCNQIQWVFHDDYSLADGSPVSWLSFQLWRHAATTHAGMKRRRLGSTVPGIGGNGLNEPDLKWLDAEVKTWFVNHSHSCAAATPCC